MIWGPKTKHIGESDLRIQHLHSQIESQMDKLNQAQRDFSEINESVSNEASNTVATLREEVAAFKDRFLALINSVDDLIVVKDPSGEWIYANEFSKRIYHVTQEWVGKTFEQLGNETNNAFITQSIEYSKRTDAEAWEKKRSVRSIHSMIDDKGRKRYFDIIKTPVFGDEEKTIPKELVIIGRDITEEVAASQRSKALMSALNQLTDIFMLVDNDGVVQFASDAFLEVYNFHKHSDIEGKKISTIKSGLHSDKFYQRLWSTVTANRQFSGKVINRGNRDYLTVCDVTIIPVMNHDPMPILYFAFHKNFRRVSEEEAKVIAQEIEELMNATPRRRASDV